MRSDHLSKHVKRHPGFEPDMLSRFRRDKPKGLVSILINNGSKENEEEILSGDQKKQLRDVAPSHIQVTRADSVSTNQKSDDSADD